MSVCITDYGGVHISGVWLTTFLSYVSHSGLRPTVQINAMFVFQGFGIDGFHCRVHVVGRSRALNVP